ncbi:hypothetical protein F2Q68_00034791 [Brassica cretica]|uniref:Uncharacterized protein n=1 Tax=Brassica cretica TaxID=69181 RepID=A0A8S9GYH0_BRACR|nr:hypothetical protein F2Q68_00034791 [Brassica cretica]
MLISSCSFYPFVDESPFVGREECQKIYREIYGDPIYDVYEDDYIYKEIVEIRSMMCMKTMLMLLTSSSKKILLREPSTLETHSYVTFSAGGFVNGVEKSRLIARSALSSRCTKVRLECKAALEVDCLQFFN